MQLKNGLIKKEIFPGNWFYWEPKEEIIIARIIRDSEDEWCLWFTNSSRQWLEDRNKSFSDFEKYRGMEEAENILLQLFPNVLNGLRSHVN